MRSIALRFGRRTSLGARAEQNAIPFLRRSSSFAPCSPSPSSLVLALCRRRARQSPLHLAAPSAAARFASSSGSFPTAPESTADNYSNSGDVFASSATASGFVSSHYSQHSRAVEGDFAGSSVEERLSRDSGDSSSGNDDEGSDNESSSENDRSSSPDQNHRSGTRGRRKQWKSRRSKDKPQRVHNAWLKIFRQLEPKALRRMDHRARIGGIEAINAHLQVLLECKMEWSLPHVWSTYLSAAEQALSVREEIMEESRRWEKVTGVEVPVIVDYRQSDFVDIVSARRMPKVYHKCPLILPQIAPNKLTEELLEQASSRSQSKLSQIDNTFLETAPAAFSWSDNDAVDPYSVISSVMNGKSQSVSVLFGFLDRASADPNFQLEPQSYAALISAFGIAQISDWVEHLWQQHLQTSNDVWNSFVGPAYFAACLNTHRTGCALEALERAVNSARCFETEFQTLFAVAISCGDLATALKVLQRWAADGVVEQRLCLGDISALFSLCFHHSDSLGIEEVMSCASAVFSPDTSERMIFEIERRYAGLASNDLDAIASTYILDCNFLDGVKAFLVRFRIFERERTYFHFDLSRILARGRNPGVTSAFLALKEVVQGFSAEEREQYSRAILRFVNLLLASCTNLGEETLALEIFEAIPSFGIQADVDTITAMISCCEQTMNADAAVGFLALAQEQGIELTASTYKVFLGTMSRTGNVESACALIAQLEDITRVAREEITQANRGASSDRSPEQIDRYKSLSLATRCPTWQHYAIVARLCARYGHFEAAEDLAVRAETRIKHAGPRDQWIAQRALFSLHAFIKTHRRRQQERMSQSEGDFQATGEWRKTS